MSVKHVQAQGARSLFIAVLLAGLVLALSPAAPVRAAEYACTEQGLDSALSDGPQSLTPEMFGQLMKEITPLAHAMGRSVGPDSPLMNNVIPAEISEDCGQ